jgi:FkbM family methyltransferase
MPPSALHADKVFMTATAVFRLPTGRLQLWRRRLYCEALRRLGHRHMVVEAQGAHFLVGLTDLIDRHIAHLGMWEASQLEDLARVCQSRRVDCFFDVGANTGFYTVMLASKRLVEKVVAFEPDPGNYARLMANLALNDLTGRVRALPVAVGREAGEVILAQAGPDNRGESWVMHPDKAPEEAAAVARHRVHQIKFDDEFALTGKTLVIKLDVEGSEFHALEGMRRTLAENLCYLQVELYSDRIAELKQFFSALGYRYLHTDYIDHFFTNMPDLMEGVPV